jgi:hypothetical protein
MTGFCCGAAPVAAAPHLRRTILDLSLTVVDKKSHSTGKQ